MRKVVILLTFFFILTSCGSVKIDWDSSRNKQIARDIHSGILVADITNEDVDIQEDALVILSYCQVFLKQMEPNVNLDISGILALIRHEVTTEPVKRYLSVDPRIIKIVLNTIEGKLDGIQVEMEDDALKNVRVIVDLVIERLEG